MNNLVRAETLKLRTTRTFWVLVSLVVAVVVAGVGAMSGTSSFSSGDHPAREVLALAGPAQTLAIILGILTITAEFRHQTITAALLITPGRTPLLAAKFLTLMLVGLAIGLLVFGLAAIVETQVLAARHIPTRADTGAVAAIIAGGAIATAMAAALGVGIGAVIRNQTTALLTALGVLYIVEPLLSVVPGIGQAVQRFGIAGLTSGAAGTTGFPSSRHAFAQPAAILVLGAYALTLFIAAAIRFGRADVQGASS